MTSACLAMIAPPFFPSTTTAAAAAAAAAVDQFQFQFQSQFQPQFQCLPRLQEVKGLLPLHFHAQPTKFDPHLSNLDPLSLGIGITEQCTRHSRILSYLMSPSASTSALSSNIQMMPINIDTLMQMPPEQTELLVQFLGRLSPGSLLTVDPSGRILFTGNPSEMRDLLSILAEFNTPPVLHQPQHHTSNVSLLVPYFDRTRGRAKAASRVALLNYPTETLVPSKSNGTNKTKSQKKRQKKTTNYNRDIFQKNYFHVCESLLTLLLDKNSTSTGRGTGAAILSLRKLGPEIAHILTSFSIGIAGTGLAVLFSVACKTAGPGTRLPILATRVFNTGFGFGLFWLSWAVNGLRDTIVQVFKDSNKLNMKDEATMTLKVERSMRDVLFRAGTLVALAALRFA